MKEVPIREAMEIALAHLDAGRLAQAESICREVLRQQPNNTDAMQMLGIVALQSGHRQAALDLLRRAVVIAPTRSECHSNLGHALRECGQTDESIAECREAIRLDPRNALPYANLTSALWDKGLPDEAMAACEEALRIKPDFALAMGNKGQLLHELGRYDESVALLSEALRLKPDLADVQLNLGMAQLLRGNMAEGWNNFECRWRSPAWTALRRPFTQPKWNGGNLRGKTILLHAEQGLGDAIQFVRYVPMVAERGATVLLESRAETVRLFQGIAGVSKIFVRDQPLPSFDLHCPLLSLPTTFGTMLDSIRAAIPYLHAEEKLAKSWADRLRATTALKVGLVWAGSAKHHRDKRRSIALAQLAPLAAAAVAEGNIEFHSLQKGEAAGQAMTEAGGLRVIDHAGELADFADTAALVANLDLIIGVDTAPIHLAGAMGKPVWTLLPYVPDWRWLLGRETTPWYPTMRLFRQPAMGDWDGAIRRLAAALAEWRRSLTPPLAPGGI